MIGSIVLGQARNPSAKTLRRKHKKSIDMEFRNPFVVSWSSARGSRGQNHGLPSLAALAAENDRILALCQL